MSSGALQRGISNAETFSNGPALGMQYTGPAQRHLISIISNLARGVSITAPLATIDEAIPHNLMDKGTAEAYNIPQEPCEGKWIRAPSGYKRCDTVAVFHFMFPMMAPLEVSRKPTEVRMYIFDGGPKPLVLFGGLFLHEMMQGAFGDNSVHPAFFSPTQDVALHRPLMPQYSTQSTYVYEPFGLLQGPHGYSANRRAAYVAFDDHAEITGNPPNGGPRFDIDQGQPDLWDPYEGM